MSMPKLSVIVPTNRDIYKKCLDSIRAQTFQDFEVIVEKGDRTASQNRNEGYTKASGELLLFSDDDIFWEPYAFEIMADMLEREPEAAFSYGWFEFSNAPETGKIARVPFDAKQLRKKNYISTMSMVRREDFPGFDESLKRHQDWDLWLTIVGKGKKGAYCGDDHRLFTTESKQGISSGHAGIGIAESASIVAEKHGILFEELDETVRNART